MLYLLFLLPLAMCLLYEVGTLPGASFEVPPMYAGQMPISENDKLKLFFWLFQQKTGSHDRLVIWLNGGPGCLSMDGALMEVGPFRVGVNGSLSYNEGTWLEDADLLFVDQPKGTGLLTTNGSYEHDLRQILQDFWSFYSGFLDAFPNYEDADVYIAGESYAGQYIPYIAKVALDGNDALRRKETVSFMVHNGGVSTVFDAEKQVDSMKPFALRKPVNLKGLLIGNGHIYPDVQLLLYLPFALETGLLSTENATQYNQVAKAHYACKTILESNLTSPVGDNATHNHVLCTDTILELLLNATRKVGPENKTSCYNMYDYRLQLPFPSCGMEWPFDLPDVTSWLRDPSVLKSLNVDPDVKWTECNSKVLDSLVNTNTSPSYFLLEGLLSRVPIVLYNGDRDITCNHLGVENLTNTLLWGGSTGWSGLDFKEMSLGGESVGRVKSARNLTLMQIYNASHMVPYDKSYASRVTLNYMLGNYGEKAKEVVFPDLAKHVDVKHFNVAFMVVFLCCLAITWVAVVLARVFRRRNYLRLD